MDDLIEFLRAEIDEDEQVALAASPGPWRPNAEHDEVLAVDDITVADGFALSGNQLRATVDHIASWDPARVLAEVDAKRKLIERYQAARQRQADNSDKFVLLTKQRHLDQTEFTRVKTHGWELSGQVAALATAVAVAAMPYADRPGYQEQWHPA